jgi:PhnB protein
VTTISPWLSVSDTAKALDYYKAAYGAVELDRLEDHGNVEVAHLSIDGAEFWVQRDPSSNPAEVSRGSVRMILSVDDPDAVFAKALAAGATEVAAVYEGHGWRIGRLADPCGHHWEVGRPL